MSKQYGFSYSPARCVQCHTCELACKSSHDIEPWVQWRHVGETWNGKYPDVTRTFFSLACMHCEEPACMTVCPTGAITKREEDGIVIVDREKCNGCRDCLEACPFDVPQFGKDGIMQKCDFCINNGGIPVCAESCPSGALKYGVLDELLETTTDKTVRRMDGSTGPSMAIIS
jgi:anaerobic dimethyl sulfoxide reductase subunit B (iron-sulfur subunit)